MKVLISAIALLALVGCGSPIPQIMATTPGSITIKGYKEVGSDSTLEQTMANAAQEHCSQQNMNAVLTIAAPTDNGWVLNNTYECR
jgi:hypothetical protein